MFLCAKSTLSNLIEFAALVAARLCGITLCLIVRGRENPKECWSWISYICTSYDCEMPFVFGCHQYLFVLFLPKITPIFQYAVKTNAAVTLPSIFFGLLRSSHLTYTAGNNFSSFLFLSISSHSSSSCIFPHPTNFFFFFFHIPSFYFASYTTYIRIIIINEKEKKSFSFLGGLTKFMCCEWMRQPEKHHIERYSILYTVYGFCTQIYVQHVVCKDNYTRKFWYRWLWNDYKRTKFYRHYAHTLTHTSVLILVIKMFS